MAEFLWTFAVQEVLRKIVKVAAQQIGLARGLEKELSNLTKWLQKAETILRDINRKKSHSDSVRLWVEDLQDVVHEADDLLDELVYEHLRRKVEIGKINKVRDSFSTSHNVFLFRLKMAKKIKDITQILHKHYCEASPLGLVGQESTEANQIVLSQIRDTTSNLNFEVVGREDEVSNIVKLVIDSSNEHHMSILPIVGMGGLGKTTFAQKIFNHDTIKGHFDNIIWVCVSEPFIIINILEGIFQSLTKTSSGLNHKGVLLEKIQKEMHGKMYFLVLDDVWNEESGLWDDLGDCLKQIAGKSGNCIIVTTRSLEVANIVGTVPSHRLKKLSDDQCWFLFKESANANRLSMNPKLEIIRDMLVKKIGGVPLVAKVLGGATKFEGDYERWVTKVESVVRNISNDDKDFVSSILKLSVDCLPLLSLKQCFAYCSNFAKDCLYDKENLIRIWIAQGFIQPQDQEGDNEMTEEDIGEWHFNFLLSRSLFQDVTMDKSERGIYFIMHDLIHDIACAISNHQKLLHELSSSNRSRKSARKLRTLICNNQVIYNELVDCVSLRVLVLHCEKTGNLLESIGKLKHLRYLSIANGNYVDVLPESIVMLYNLQTLKLRHMKSLPKNSRKMVSLRHLEFELKSDFRQMPSHMSELIHLQTLSRFVAGFENGCKIEELGPLKNLKGKLQLSCLERVESKEESIVAKLVEKKNLQELIFEWSSRFEGKNSRYSELEVLEGLQPHKNLQSLTVIGFGGQVLGDAIFVENLTVIRLSNCKNCERLPMLGRLPNLVELNINSMDSLRCIGSEFYGNGSNNQGHSFSKLRKLTFIWCRNLEQWKDAAVVSNSFGSLQTLSIYGCGNLEKLPNGLEGCSSLRDLTVAYCPKLSLNVQNCQNLSNLRIDGLKKLPLGLGHLTNLKEMKFVGCMQDYDFTPFVSLQSLIIKLELRDECSGNCTQLPPHLQHLTALKQLSIGNFGGIEVPPEWLNNLTSLEMLSFEGCENLRRLPSTEAIRRLTKLELLSAIKCPLLYGGCNLILGVQLLSLCRTQPSPTVVAQLPWADQDDGLTREGEKDGSTTHL
ncbi:disease resistance protein RGA2-like [Momordica charantia]|uniref:Disease resistance protein RGA2-like n=1 Tax=Momordica charantia TaxID=3673 RepID=A0A6J1CU86_MOMCH|nr:disease resistance protein RGA2-like [Momordica charantia]